MRVEQLAIAEVLLLTPRRFEDDRGYFSETYNQRAFSDNGVDASFVQDNQSYSAKKGTVRGLHFQAPPHAQAKLVRVLSGAILDVAVDARKESPTFGRWVSAELSAENGVQIFVPAGFLHGFITLEDETVVAYKVDSFYDSGSEGSILWNDQDLAIDWRIGRDHAMLSQKDARAQSWASFKSPF